MLASWKPSLEAATAELLDRALPALRVRNVPRESPNPEASFSDRSRAGRKPRRRWPADGAGPGSSWATGHGPSGHCRGGPAGRQGLHWARCAPSPGPRVSGRHCWGSGRPCPRGRPPRPALRCPHTGLCRERRRELWKGPGLHFTPALPLPGPQAPQLCEGSDSRRGPHLGDLTSIKLFQGLGAPQAVSGKGLIRVCKNHRQCPASPGHDTPGLSRETSMLPPGGLGADDLPPTPSVPLGPPSPQSRNQPALQADETLT